MQSADSDHTLQNAASNLSTLPICPYMVARTQYLSHFVCGFVKTIVRKSV